MKKLKFISVVQSFLLIAAMASIWTLAGCKPSKPEPVAATVTKPQQ